MSGYFEVIVDAVTGQATTRPWTAQEIAAEQAAASDTATLIAAYQRALAAHVDAVAGQRNYTDGAHCASYVASTIPLWAAEATAFVAWRDAVWLQAVTLLAAVQAGEEEAPTVEALIAGLPAMVWPE